MLGVSLPKAVLLLLVIGAIWFGYRLYLRGRAARERASAFAAPEETRSCAVCGSFVAASLGRPCGLPNCPFGA